MGKMSRIYRLMSIAFALIFVNCTNAEEAAAAPSGSGDSKPEVPVLPETVKILAIGNKFLGRCGRAGVVWALRGRGAKGGHRKYVYRRMSSGNSCCECRIGCGGLQLS